MSASGMRDCIFLVADKNMEAAFKGFLEREGCCQSLGIAGLEFDAKQDLIVGAGQNDPGVYTRAHDLLQLYQKSHRYAIVVLDEAWNGSPRAVKIEAEISANLIKRGWTEDRFVVIVICPELEAWICHQSEHVEQVFGFRQTISMRDWLQERTLWEVSHLKPADPKVTVETVLKHCKKPRSSRLYQQITEKVTVKRCVDPAFNKLRDALQAWFPVEKGV